MLEGPETEKSQGGWMGGGVPKSASVLNVSVFEQAETTCHLQMTHD